MWLHVKFVLGLLAAYLLGSIPTAYIAGKLYKGIDIRKHGSRNVGATNVYRVLGKVPGTIVLAIDIFKGVLAVVGVAEVFGLHKIVYYIALGIAVVCGHNWTIFLNFRGGKGVATGLGVLIGLTMKIAALRLVVALLVLTWGVIFLLWGYVSLASITAVVVLPLLMLVFTQNFELVLLGIVFCLFVIFRHRANIQRLLAGEEHRASFAFFKKRRR